LGSAGAEALSYIGFDGLCRRRQPPGPLNGGNRLPYALHSSLERVPKLPKPNYAFAKRQRDLAKQQRKEEKRKKKAAPNETPPLVTDAQSSTTDKTKS
jgi:hypothetical protein